jgi:HTH-type transcriptional regulator, quorum sensing regulator NprR
MDIGERIRQLRIHQRMTQKKLVNGISSVTYLSRIENGQIKPSRNFLEQISGRLHIPLEDLLEPDIQEKESEIVEMTTAYWKNRTLTNEGLSFLQIHAREMHRPTVLVKIYGALISHYVQQDQMDEAQTAYNMSKQMISVGIEKTKQPLDYMFYYYACGKLFYNIQDFNKADYYYTKAELYIDESSDSIDNAKLYYNLALVKQSIQHDMTTCLQYSYRAYEIFSRHDDIELLMASLITIGSQNRLAGNYTTAMEFLEEAKCYANDLDSAYWNSLVHYHFGQVYKAKGDSSTAEDYFLKSLSYGTNVELGTQKIYLLRSLLYLAMENKDWVKANQYLSEALDIVNNNEEMTYLYIEIHSLKAEMYKHRQNERTYEKEMRKVIDMAMEKEQYKLIHQLSKKLGSHYYQERAYKKAADYLMLSLQHL